MNERRIPYSLPMARARRSGIKTQTRRIASHPALLCLSRIIDCGDGWWGDEEGEVSVLCPYGKPGDILLPTEPWRAPVEFDDKPPRDIPAGTPIWLDANGQAPEAFGRYRHAKFMPKHLITARDEVLTVRVQRLLDISEADAQAEGITKVDCAIVGSHSAGGVHYETTATRFYFDGCQDDGFESAGDAYMALWDVINGVGATEADPYIWSIEFKVLVP